MLTQNAGPGVENALAAAASGEYADVWVEELFSPCFMPSRHTVYAAEQVIRKMEEFQPAGYRSLHVWRNERTKSNSFLVC